MLCVLLGRSVAAVKPNSSRSLLSSILQSTTDSEKKQVRSRCWLNRNIFCVHKLLYLPLKALKASKKGGQIGTYIKKFDGLLGDDIALEDEKRLFFSSSSSIALQLLEIPSVPGFGRHVYCPWRQWYMWHCCHTPLKWCWKMEMLV